MRERPRQACFDGAELNASLLVELRHQLERSGEVFDWLPGCLADGVALPLDQVLINLTSAALDLAAIVRAVDKPLGSAAVVSSEHWYTLGAPVQRARRARCQQRRLRHGDDGLRLTNGLDRSRD